MSEEWLFVYGTLRRSVVRGSMRNLLANNSEYFTEGTLQGKLFDIAGYPGAIQSSDPGDKVFGEIYRIVRKHPLLVKLDEFEGCTEQFPHPHEYIRKKLLISVLSGDGVSAWVYIYNQNVLNRQQIKSGDYLSFLNEDVTNTIFHSDSHRKGWF